ncbi:MAG: hypothetical protein ACO306_04910 [Flavobacteriaceae bacterium]
MKIPNEIKSETLVWILASVSDVELQSQCDKDEIVVEPHGRKSMPLYTSKDWVKPLTKQEVEEYYREIEEI